MAKGESKLRKDCWNARSEIRYRLSLYPYWDLVRKTRKRSKMTRAMEKLRLLKKEDWISVMKENCA